jgi:hypothetical protein
MTSALGIAGVSAALRNLLNDGLINNNVSGTLGSTVTVSVGPPDKVVAANGTEASQLNLFLHRVTPNTGWSNQGLPSYGASGRDRLTNPPLALDLHYLISAYSGADLHGEILLGYGMQLLHETPVLSRLAVRNALTMEPPTGTVLPPALRALADAGLENQPELIRISPEYLNTEEMSKLWAATLSHLRPTAAYVVSVVLIQANGAVRSPIPVLSRGPVDPVTGREGGVVVIPSLVPPLPTVESIEFEDEQPVARVGKLIEVNGHHLSGAGRAVLFSNERFEVVEELPASGPNEPGRMQVTIPPARRDDFPVGAYKVGVRLTPEGESQVRESNRLAITVAPEITQLPAAPVARVAGTATFSVDVLPSLRRSQTVSLLLGQLEFTPQPFSDLATQLDFVIPDAPVQAAPGHLVRVRVDGIDSTIIDYESQPPKFLDTRIVIT